MTTDWKADPKRGAELVEPRRKETVDALKRAADVAFYHLEEKLQRDIEELKKKNGDAKNKITQAVKKAENMLAMDVVRKYWGQSKDDIMNGLIETIVRNNT